MSVTSDPFRRERRVEERPRGRMGRVWDHLFRSDDAEKGDALLSDAREFVAWIRAPYYSVFMQWLRDKADQPIKVGNHADMIGAAAASNTYREIIRHLHNHEKQCKSLLGDD